MYSYLLAFNLPRPIKQHISLLLCYGLPNVTWTEEENLHVVIRHLGSLNDAVLFDVQDRLATLTFTPFQMALQGIEQARSKGGQGEIRTYAKASDELIKIKKEVDQKLKGLIPEQMAQLQVILGKYEYVSPQRLGDYLAQHHLYQSSFFEMSHLSLLQIQSTPQHTFYKEIERYPHPQNELLIRKNNL